MPARWSQKGNRGAKRGLKREQKGTTGNKKPSWFHWGSRVVAKNKFAPKPPNQFDWKLIDETVKKGKNAPKRVVLSKKKRV